MTDLNQLEAIIACSEEPISKKKLKQNYGFTDKNIDDLLEQLHARYKDTALEIAEVASGFRLQTKAAYNQSIIQLYNEKPAKYSKAQLETLALIAYKQPITRAEIEYIRGVAVSSNIIKTLIEREWIYVVGHKDVIGKPGLYATTKQFLDYFNLTSLEQLPPISQIKQEDILSQVETIEKAAKKTEENTNEQTIH